MKVLITGGAGFIGSHLAEQFEDVTVLDDLSTGSLDNLSKNVNFVRGSVVDFDTVSRVMKNMDYVFHLAAKVGVHESVSSSEKTYEVNVKGTENVLRAAFENNVKKVIFVSSAAVYGDNTNLPLKESAFLNPLSPYGQSKAKSEELCKEYNQKWLNVVCLRPFNVFGPRQSPNSLYTGVIPKFIDCSLKNQDLTIFGDGEQIRDFIYINDAVKAFLLAMGKGEGPYNIAGGNGVNVNQLASSIIRLTNSTSKVKHIEAKSGGIKKSIADTNKINQLGFEPAFSFEQGLNETIGYLRKQHENS